MREQLYSLYSLYDNCTNLKASVLNPKISHYLTKEVNSQDGIFSQLQAEVGFFTFSSGC